MKQCIQVVVGSMLLSAMTVGPTMAADARIDGMRLLPGFTHQPLQGFDSIGGKIGNKDGLQINYDIGGIPKPGGLRLGCQFSDRPKLTPKKLVRWYREQVVNQQPVHLAYRKDNYSAGVISEEGRQLLSQGSLVGRNGRSVTDAADLSRLGCRRWPEKTAAKNQISEAEVIRTFRQSRSARQINSPMGFPSGRIGIGRPALLTVCQSVSMPKCRYRVANTSVGPTGR